MHHYPVKYGGMAYLIWMSAYSKGRHISFTYWDNVYVGTCPSCLKSQVAVQYLNIFNDPLNYLRYFLKACLHTIKYGKSMDVENKGHFTFHPNAKVQASSANSLKTSINFWTIFDFVQEQQDGIDMAVQEQG